MREISILFVILTIMLTMSCQQKVNIEAEKSAITTVLDSYVRSIENEDMELYGENIAHEPMMVNFGAFGDPIIGWDAL